MIEASQVRCDETDRKILMALANAGLSFPCSGKKVNTSKKAIRFLIEHWINTNPENNLQSIYNGGKWMKGKNKGFCLNIPGYAYQWDVDVNKSLRPDYIQIAQYLPDPVEEEVRFVRNKITGEVRCETIGKPKDYFMGDTPDASDDEEEIDEDVEDDEEDEQVLPVVNLFEDMKTHERFSLPIGQKPPVDAMFVKVIVDLNTGNTREVLVPSDNSPIEYAPNETIAEFVKGENGDVDIRWSDDPGEDDDDDELPSQPEYTAVDDSQILRSDK